MLTLMQARVLKNFLEDSDGQAAISAFVLKEKSYHMNRCSEQMRAGNQKDAEMSAWFSQAYDTVLPELLNFARTQMEQHE